CGGHRFLDRLVEQPEEAHREAAAALESFGRLEQSLQAEANMLVAGLLRAGQSARIAPEIGQLLDDLLLQLRHGVYFLSRSCCASLSVGTRSAWAGWPWPAVLRVAQPYLTVAPAGSGRIVDGAFRT